jgi:type I restriction enzyme S subunit
MNDDLPQGWATTTLDEVIEECQSGFASGEKDVRGGVAQLRMNNIGVRGDLLKDLIRHVPASLTRPQYELRRGDVLVCTTNSGKLVGKCAYFDLSGRYAFSNHLTRLRPIGDVIDGRFLRWNLWFQWKQGNYNDKCKHWVNQSSLPKDALLASEVVVPPIAEQIRIVTRLGQLVDRVDSCQKRLAIVPVLMKRFRQSVLAAACSGRLTADWRQEIAEHSESTTRNGETNLPESWTSRPFSDFIESSFYGPRFSAESYSTKGVSTIRTTDMSFDGAIVLRDAPRVSLSKKELDKLRVQHGDLLITRTGATIGKCAIYDDSLGPAIPSAYLIRFRLKRDAVVPRFALRFLMSPMGQNLLIGGSTAVAQPNVNATTISQFMVPSPPLGEQREIVRRVEELFGLADHIEARLAKAQEQVDRLVPSLLVKAFRGELVPTEAELAKREGREYESASALLDRIKSGRDERRGVSVSMARNLSRGPARSVGKRTPGKKHVAR